MSIFINIIIAFKISGLSAIVSNAIVKKIERIENNKETILYGDEDSRPMYISYRGFKTENEAKKEMEKIMHHKQLYVDALTVSDYIKNL